MRAVWPLLTGQFFVAVFNKISFKKAETENPNPLHEYIAEGKNVKEYLHLSISKIELSLADLRMPLQCIA